MFTFFSADWQLGDAVDNCWKNRSNFYWEKWIEGNRQAIAL